MKSWQVGIKVCRSRKHYWGSVSMGEMKMKSRGERQLRPEQLTRRCYGKSQRHFLGPEFS